MRLPAGFYDKLRDTIRISEIVRKRVTLTKKGLEYSGICPFHSEKTPSFTVNDAKKFYHCFGCGAHGDLIRFVAETQGFDYKDAAIQIAGDYGVEIPKVTIEEAKKYELADRLQNLLEVASQFFVNQLTNEIETYLQKRGILKQTIKDFAIGYAPSGQLLEKYLYDKGFSGPELIQSGLFGKRDDDRIYPVFHSRIMFPIKNTFNKIVAFGGRALGDVMPKYINSPETILFKKSEIMFGQNIANKYFYQDNYAIVVEGYMDVISLHQAGFKHAVASLGTAVTQNHLDKLWNSCDEIIICLDGDAAGQRAANKIIEMVLPSINANKSVSFIELPAFCDPDDLVNKNGAEAFAVLLKKKISLSEKIWRNEYLGKVFNSAESRATLEQKFSSYCQLIHDRTLKINFQRYFNEMIWNNIIRGKKTHHNQINLTLSNEVLVSEKYSEIDFLEHAICTFLIYFPQYIDTNNLDIKLTNVKLESLKSYIIDYIASNDKLELEFLLSNLKNSRFFEIFTLLSEQKNLFLRDVFLDKNQIDKQIFLQWLCKKHYLMVLKMECGELLRGENISEKRLDSYLKEITKISKELDGLNENFAS